MPRLALGHLKLLDLSRQLPGPFCSTLLADLGMDVLVVTAPHDPFGTGIPFLARNKRSMTLDLKTEAGRDVFRRLAAGADVVLEGFRPGVAARLGIDHATLAAANPRLVYCAITGYGQDGPYRDRVGHDVNYLGYAGVLNYVGEAGRAPVIPGVQIADIGGGALMAAVGILAALAARERSGRGQFVDVAMLDGMVAWTLLIGTPGSRIARTARSTWSPRRAGCRRAASGRGAGRIRPRDSASPSGCRSPGCPR